MQKPIDLKSKLDRISAVAPVLKAINGIINMNYIEVEKLKQHFPNPITWDDITVTMDDIISNINQVKEIEEQFPFQWDIERFNNRCHYTKKWHIGRIKYFVNHPDKIKPLKLIFEDGKIKFYDGCHRFLAHVLRNDIMCAYEEMVIVNNKIQIKENY